MLSGPLSLGRHKKQTADVGQGMVWNCQLHSQEFSEENEIQKQLYFLRERKAKTSGNSAPPPPPTLFYTEVVD